MDDATMVQTIAQVADMRVEVARLSTRVDAVLSQMPVQLTDHESRLRSLERWRYGIPVGAGAAITAAALTAVQMVWG
jgi:hypothetical protein